MTATAHNEQGWRGSGLGVRTHPMVRIPQKNTGYTVIANGQKQWKNPCVEISLCVYYV